MYAKLILSCPTLCSPMDCSPPGSSARGILQARTLEWVAVSSSRGSSLPRNRTHVYCISQISRIAGGFFATRTSQYPKKKKYKFFKKLQCVPLMCCRHSWGQKTVLNLESRGPSHGQVQQSDEPHRWAGGGRCKEKTPGAPGRCI